MSHPAVVEDSKGFPRAARMESDQPIQKPTQMYLLYTQGRPSSKIALSGCQPSIPKLLLNNFHKYLP